MTAEKPAIQRQGRLVVLTGEHGVHVILCVHVSQFEELAYECVALVDAGRKPSAGIHLVASIAALVDALHVGQHMENVGAGFQVQVLEAVRPVRPVTTLWSRSDPGIGNGGTNIRCAVLTFDEEGLRKGRQRTATTKTTAAPRMYIMATMPSEGGASWAPARNVRIVAPSL